MKKMTEEAESTHIDAICEHVEALGWHFAIPAGDDPDEEILGMVIGTEDYIEAILGRRGSA